MRLVLQKGSVYLVSPLMEGSLQWPSAYRLPLYFGELHLSTYYPYSLDTEIPIH